MRRDNSELSFTNKSKQLLEELIKMRPEKSIYAGLLTLHPRPSKEDLLPYINEGSLSIVCLRNLLALDKEKMEAEEIKAIFFAIFKLLNCHLWEDQGI